MREGLQLALERSEEFEVVGTAKDGVEACREIMESLPETRVIMLTASMEANAVIEAVAAGATGYLRTRSGIPFRVPAR